MGTECRIAIINRWKTSMQMGLKKANEGNWDPEPPGTIKPGQIASFALKGSDGGSKSTVNYSFSYPSNITADVQTADVQFQFSNPAQGSSNVVDWLWVQKGDPRFNGTIEFIAKVGDDRRGSLMSTICRMATRSRQSICSTGISKFYAATVSAGIGQDFFKLRSQHVNTTLSDDFLINYGYTKETEVNPSRVF